MEHMVKVESGGFVSCRLTFSELFPVELTVKHCTSLTEDWAEALADRRASGPAETALSDGIDSLVTLRMPPHPELAAMLEETLQKVYRDYTPKRVTDVSPGFTWEAKKSGVTIKWTDAGFNGLPSAMQLVLPTWAATILFAQMVHVWQANMLAQQKMIGLYSLPRKLTPNLVWPLGRDARLVISVQEAWTRDLDRFLYRRR